MNLNCQIYQLTLTNQHYMNIGFLQEHISKFCVNSMRCYEFFEYSWYPLWDMELVEFFRTLPIKHRINNVFYNHYVDNIDTTLSKINPANPKLFIDPFRKIIYHLSNLKLLSQ